MEQFENLRLPNGSMLLAMDGKTEFTLGEKIMSAFIDALCDIGGDVTKLILNLEESNSEKFHVMKETLSNLRNSWDLEFSSLLQFLTFLESESDIDGTTEDYFRTPDENAFLLIRNPQGDYSDKQRILVAYISGKAIFSGDVTKLLLTLGRDKKEIHKIVSPILEELRKNWDIEYDLLVEYLNKI